MGLKKAELIVTVARMPITGPWRRNSGLSSMSWLGDIESHTVKHTFVLPSFDLYYSPVERGGASIGQALAALPEEIRRAVRKEVRRDLADRGRYVSLWHSAND